MTPTDIDRVFGRSRLRMVTGEHVEVFREASLPGERRRYTKRFLATAAGDFRQWTEREWRILARLVGHGIGPVPDVVQFDRGASDRPALVQTYDAGVTVDHWATLLPVERAGSTRHHVFEDCAHWWALARHCLIALDAIHQLQLVHLDLKADNVCIPAGPADFDPHAPDALLHLRFEQITLIDFAFSLVSGERLDSALPIARQTEYDYQSPRLLQALEAGAAGDLAPTRQLDWRCDIFSLAAMLRRYLPDPERAAGGDWTPQRLAQARTLIRRLLDVHDAELPVARPHADLVALASVPLQDDELAASLQQGWTLATGHPVPRNEWPTPVTRIAMPVVTGVDAEPITIDPSDIASRSKAVDRPQRRHRRTAWAAALVGLAAASVPLLGHQWLGWRERTPDPAASPTAGSQTDQIRSTPPAPATVAMAAGADSARKAGDAAPPEETASAPQGRAESVPSAPARAVGPPAEPASPAVEEPAQSPAPASTATRQPAGPSSEPRVGETARSPDPASTTPARSTAVARKRAAALPSAPPPVSARVAKAMPAEVPRTRAGVALGKPSGVASAKPQSAVQERSAPREAAHAPTRFASADKSKTRTVAASRSGALAPPAVRVASATAKRDLGSKAVEPVVVAPAAAPAPEPWPHTAMASGMASAKPPAGARRAAPPVPAPHAPSQPVVSANERTAVASAPMPPAVGSAPPFVPGPTVRPVIAPSSPPDWTAEPTDPSGPRPSISAERSRVAPPVFVPSPPVHVSGLETRVAAPPDFAARAADVMANQLPRIAQRAERSVMKVLFTAARSDAGAPDDEIRQAASAMRRAPDEALAELALAAGDARQLNDAARAAFYRRGSAREAADLQLRAFGANPTDPEVVGTLAFLRLKQQPAQAESARQLALHALTLPDARFPHGRLEDWTTFAIASALAGRERDARNAWWVTAALAPNLQRQCRVATDAYALYGERLRPSVESMLQRLHATGRPDGTAFCNWPPYWTVGSNR